MINNPSVSTYVTSNYRENATYAWLVVTKNQHHEEAIAYKSLVLYGVRFRPVGIFGKKGRRGPMVVCDRMLPFDQNRGLPGIVVPAIRVVRMEGPVFQGCISGVTLIEQVEVLAVVAGFTEIEIVFDARKQAFVPKGGGCPITECFALTLLEDGTAWATIDTPQPPSWETVAADELDDFENVADDWPDWDWNE